mgnify:CR=1 FL=1
MSILSTFSKSIKDYLKNPILIAPPIMLIILASLLSCLSVFVNYKISNALAVTSWFVFFSAVYLLLVSFFFSGIIGMTKEIFDKKKTSLKSFWFYSKKFFLKNFVVVLVFLIAYNLVSFTAYYGALYLGKALALSSTYAQILFTAIYFLGLLLVIFLTFSNFYLILFNFQIFTSIKKSIIFVKKRYLSTLSIVLIFFIIITLLERFVSQIIFNIALSELINLFITYPILLLVLTRFLLTEEKQK